jgi:hypothetical protein
MVNQSEPTKQNRCGLTRFPFVLTIALSGLILALYSQWRTIRSLKAEIGALHGEIEERDFLRATNQHLSETLKASEERVNANLSELMRFRAEAGTKRQEQDSLRAENQSLSESLKTLKKRLRTNLSERADQNPFDLKFGPGAGIRMDSGKRAGLALAQYLTEHQHFPTNLTELASSLQAETPSIATNVAAFIEQFELVASDFLNATNDPSLRSLVVREKRPWPAVGGAWARTYIFSDGGTLIHTEPDGNFANWEAKQGVRTVE